MARLLRGTAYYKLGKPLFIGPSFVFETTRASIAASPAQARQVHSKLRAPTILAPSIVFQPVSRTLAPSPRQGRATRSTLRAPATLAQPFTAREVRRAFTVAVRRATEQHQSFSSLAPPQAPAPLPLTFGPARKFAQPPRQSRVTTTRLRAPTVVGTTVVFTAPPPRVSFKVTIRRATEQRSVNSTLWPPGVINEAQAALAAEATRKLTQPPRQSRVTSSRLRRPVVIGAAVVLPPSRPLQVNFYDSVTRSARKRPAMSFKLRPPAVVSVPSGDNPTGGIYDPNYFITIHA